MLDGLTEPHSTLYKLHIYRARESWTVYTVPLFFFESAPCVEAELPHTPYTQVFSFNKMHFSVGLVRGRHPESVSTSYRT